MGGADHISDYFEENNAITHGSYELVLVSNKVYMIQCCRKYIYVYGKRTEPRGRGGGGVGFHSLIKRKNVLSSFLASQQSKYSMISCHVMCPILKICFAPKLI